MHVKSEMGEVNVVSLVWAGNLVVISEDMRSAAMIFSEATEALRKAGVGWAPGSME